MTNASLDGQSLIGFVLFVCLLRVSYACALFCYPVFKLLSVALQFDLMIFTAALALTSYIYSDIWSCISGILPNDHSFYLVLIALAFIWYNHASCTISDDRNSLRFVALPMAGLVWFGVW